MTSTSKKTLLLSFLSKNKLRVTGVIIIGFCSSILKILIPIALAKYYSLAFETNSPKIYLLEFFPISFTDTIPHFLMFFLGLIVITSIFDFLERLGKGVMGELFLFQLRKILFQKQLHLTQAIYDEKGTGRYLLRYSGDLKSIQGYLTKGILQFTIDILFLSLTMAVLFAINPTICLIIIGCTLITLVFMIFVNRWLYRISMVRRNRKSNLLSFVNIHLRSILSVKSFNKEKSAYKKYERRVKKILDLGVNYHIVNSFIQATTKSMVYIMLAGILAFVHLSSWQSGSELLITVLLLVTILPLFRRTLRVYSIWELGNISFSKLLNILNLPSDQNKIDPSIQRISGNRIIVRNLNFKLGDKVLFENLSLTIRSKSISLVTGKGKTTFVKLLLGIYRNYSGTIKVNRTNIRHLAPKVIRRKITIISADWPLYGKTVFDAISYNKKEKKRIAAAELLALLQNNQDEKLTLDMPIGEMGQLLSYNQYILLCFARAILTRKKIILIDIQFQNLAPQLQLTLTQYINSIKQNKTIVIFGQDEAQFPNIQFDRKHTLNTPSINYLLN
ncbi:ABC transporter transmembrane domain-containing protein [Aureispira anguillae]|uniref:ABC transporter ATP-binding protein/permease n=1 Tax=Aureispira anguillae TaxID=2864201 RepID=A0A915YBG1_9BACT|nr:ABC transporter ATP-binding protein [Aureispira anguillae]BDS10008.1 ABC transporter ATP-binding protein/permease [Aureispira anguillae]